VGLARYARELGCAWNGEMWSGVSQARWLPTRQRDGCPGTAVTFVVDTAHCQYCGALPMERAAHHSAFAEGRRGACRDYLTNTAEHARSLGIHDPYIEELVQRVADLRGGPVGVETLAAGLTEPRDTIEEVVEPFLIQLGLVARTARGRCLNESGWKHLGIAPPSGSQAGLFGPGK